MTAPPMLGRTVTYRSRTGKYDVPAIITATIDTLSPEGVAAGGTKPITGRDRVHLTVFTPGLPGKRADAKDFEVESEHPRSENVAGCYQEWDVPKGPTLDRARIDDPPAGEPEPGTWRWPERTPLPARDSEPPHTGLGSGRAPGDRRQR
jgi:hypothetical protein